MNSRSHGQRRTLARTTAAAALALALTATPAGASSLTYVKNGQLWVSSSDGSDAHLVTATGTAWKSPTVADDGTVYAFNDAPGDKAVHVFAPGVPEGTPVSVDRGLAFESLDVAPDRRHIAFMHLDSSPFDHSFTHNTTVQRLSDGRVTELLAGRWPAWQDANHVVVAGPLGSQVHDASNDTTAMWFNTSGWPHALQEAVITRAGEKVALRFDGSIADSSYASRLGIAATSDPEDPCASPARIVAERLTWSPDGSTLAWQQPDGIHQLRVGAIASCAFTDLGLVIPGASSPDWGPSDDRRFPNPAPANPGAGGPSAPGGVTVVDPVDPNGISKARPPLVMRMPATSKRSRAFAHGLPVPFAVSRGGRVTGTATIRPQDAKRRHLGSRVVARGAVSVADAGTATLTLRFTRRARSKLRRAGALILTVRLATEATTVTATTRLTP